MNGSKIKETALLKQKSYIYGFENLSALNVYFIEAFIILLFSSNLQVWHQKDKMFTKALSVRTEMPFEIFLTESKRV